MRSGPLILTALTATKPVLTTSPLTVNDYLVLCGAGILAIVVSILRDDKITARTASSELILGVLVSVVLVPWLMLKFNYDLYTGALMVVGINITLRKIWPIAEVILIEKFKKLTKKI